MSANFNNDGTWLEAETKVKTADMAAAYEVEMVKGETTIEVLFGSRKIEPAVELDQGSFLTLWLSTAQAEGEGFT